MQSAASHPLAAASDGESIPVFSVFIVYEDFATGKQAKRACDFLVANLTHEWQVTSQMWKFEVLSIPELRELAAKDAASANLILVSSRGDREVPDDVKAWIDMWLAYKGDTVALVALLGRPREQAEHAQATQTYLERVAERGRMEFFTWPEIGPGRESLPRGLVSDHWLDLEPLVPVAGLALREESFSH
jgi:hypothetical protein